MNVNNPLTRTEMIVLRWARTDLSYGEIEYRNQYASGWMRVHMANIARKFGITEKGGHFHLNRRRQAVVEKATEMGYFDD